MFYNDAERCAQISGTCLKDGLPIDGTDQPRTYTTYYTWADFFSRQEIETLFWIMLATSFIGWIAWPMLIVFTWVMQIYMAVVSW